jgi:hypothetical protein
MRLRYSVKLLLGSQPSSPSSSSQFPHAANVNLGALDWGDIDVRFILDFTPQPPVLEIWFNDINKGEWTLNS